MMVAFETFKVASRLYGRDWKICLILGCKGQVMIWLHRCNHPYAYAAHCTLQYFANIVRFLHFGFVLCFHSNFAAQLCTTRVKNEIMTPPGAGQFLHLSCVPMRPPYEDTSFRAFTFARQCSHLDTHSLPSTTMNHLSDVISLLHRPVFKPPDATSLLLFYILLPFFLPAANAPEQTRYTSLTRQQQGFKHSILCNPDHRYQSINGKR